MAQRPVWEGHLRLSLVASPVSLFTATTAANDVHFHMINPTTNSRVRQLLVDGETGEEVERKSLLRGYETAKDQYVLLSDEEIRSVRLESTRTLDIERFVDAATIDRIWWNAPYYLVPDGKAGIDAFGVIRDAMAQSGKVALARLVMSQRERVVAIEPRGPGMLVTTLRSHDEVREATELFAAIPERKPDPKMLQIAEQIIAQQEGPFDPTAFNDRYEDALREVIRQKQEEGAVAAAPAAAPAGDNVIDLMEALRRSLGEAPARAKATKPKAPETPVPAKPVAAKAKTGASRRRAASA